MSYYQQKKRMQNILDGIQNDYAAIDRVKHLTRMRPISAEAQSYKPDMPVWVLCTVGGNHPVTTRYKGVVVRPIEKLVLVCWVNKHGKTRTESLPLRRLEHRNGEL